MIDAHLAAIHAGELDLTLAPLISAWDADVDRVADVFEHGVQAAAQRHFWRRRLLLSVTRVRFDANHRRVA